MDVAEAFGLISDAIDAGRAANGYLIAGDVNGNARELVDLVLEKLFPGERDQIASRTHPDVVILEPEGKKRIISVKSMRERIVDPMGKTSFSGGWKAGVVLCADRMNENSANAFLKSLEEPSPKTVYFLLSDRPDAILPTIRSRTQRVNLAIPSSLLEGDEYEEVARAFAAKDVYALADVLSAVCDAAEDGDVALARRSFFLTVLSFVRSMALSGKLPAYVAYRNIDLVEEAYRRSGRFINNEAVISALMDRLVFPSSKQGGFQSRYNT